MDKFFSRCIRILIHQCNRIKINTIPMYTWIVPSFEGTGEVIKLRFGLKFSTHSLSVLKRFSNDYWIAQASSTLCIPSSLQLVSLAFHSSFAPAHLGYSATLLFQTQSLSRLEIILTQSRTISSPTNNSPNRPSLSTNSEKTKYPSVPILGGLSCKRISYTVQNTLLQDLPFTGQ